MAAFWTDQEVDTHRPCRCLDGKGVADGKGHSATQVGTWPPG